MRKVPVVLVAVLSVVFGTVVGLEASEHYVSPMGTAAWSDCTAKDNPCSPLTAVKNAQAGDTTYFRGGIYRVGQSSGWPSAFDWRPANSGTVSAPITFRSYPGEVPVVDGTVITGYDNTHCLGAVNRDYIVWDGFVLQANGGVKMATVLFYHSTGSILRNTTINGGTTLIQTTDNREGLRIEQSTNITVGNCKLYNFRQVNGWHNTSAIKFYHNNVGTVENCEIYNATNGIYVKSNTNDYVFRNNFIHDVGIAVKITPSLNTMQSDRGTITNNLIVNATVLGINSDNDRSSFHGDDWVISNNTLYNTRQAFGLSGNQPGHGWRIYNNISHNQAEDITTTVNTTLAQADHNQWGTGALRFRMRQYESDQKDYTSLASWQASTELDGGGRPGTGDLASDPGFSNGSGTLKVKSDFVLGAGSACRGAGRNGVDLGAQNIETAVGYKVDGLEHPAAPKGVTVK